MVIFDSAAGSKVWRMGIACLPATCILASFASTATAQVPPLPSVPTVDSCRAYMLDNHARRAGIYQEVSDCLRNFPWNFSDRYTVQVCRYPPPRLVPNTSPYNCPERAAELCALVEAESQIAECFKLAKAQQTAQEEYQQKLAKFNRLEKELVAIRSAKKDPRRVFWDVVEPRLPTDTRIQLGLAYRQTNAELSKGSTPIELTKSGSSLFVVHMFERNGEFSQRGSSLMQDTYDFVYARTISDKNMLLQKYNNPIINAIQGTAAEEIKRVHSSIVSKIDTEIGAGIDSIISESSAPASRLLRQQSQVPIKQNPSRNQQTTPPTDPTCAILDGPERTDFSINSPEAFEKLIIKCRR